MHHLVVISCITKPNILLVPIDYVYSRGLPCNEAVQQYKECANKAKENEDKDNEEEDNDNTKQGGQDSCPVSAFRKEDSGFKDKGMKECRAYDDNIGCYFRFYHNGIGSDDYFRAEVSTSPHSVLFY